MHFKQRRRLTLADLDNRNKSYWMHVLGGTPAEKYENAFDTQTRPPTRQEVAELSDEELAEVLAREPNSQLGHLAATIMRRRESWRSPARWALLISILSFAVAFMALVRAFAVGA